MKNIKKRVLEQFTTAQLVGNVKCFLDKLRVVESKFDYLVFICEMYGKQITFDLADIYYDDKFSKLNQDLESIELLKNRLTTEKERHEDDDQPVRLREDFSLGQLVKPHVTKAGRDSPGNSAPLKDNGSPDYSMKEDQKKRDIDQPIAGYYDTWNNAGWRAGAQTIQASDNPYIPDYRPEGDQEINPQSHLLTITVERAEGLVFSNAGEAGNFKFKATVSLSSPETGMDQTRDYTSDIAPRTSTPVWDFAMNYQISDLQFFMRVNSQADICIEIVNVDACHYDDANTSEDVFVTSVSGRLFEQFTENEIQALGQEGKDAPLTIEKRVTLSNHRGVKVYLKVEIRPQAESVDNPFREGLMEDGITDAERESLLKMKRTLEELKQYEIVDVDDRQVLSIQKMFENLKNTLSSSELFKAQNYSAADIQPKFGQRKLPEKRASSLVPGSETLGQSAGPISEPGKFYQSQEHQDELSLQKNAEDEIHEDPQVHHYQPNFGYNLKQTQGKIHLEDYSETSKPKYDTHYPEYSAPGNLPADQNVISVNPSFGEEQMRPTPDFPAQLESVKDDSQEGASSYNPFRQHLLNKDVGSRAEEASEDFSPPKAKTKKENNQVVKSLKDRLPGGKLKDADLERIERIFRNKKFDEKILDLEDSDLDYF